ncbi:hypothetical protein PF051_26025 (plasmid) [Klebsiella pneumoniae]|jgi:hypothetical protein|uniref:hypothetical protein n=1 Tax=Klebsiella pneumoniae TaxID=573 RepID=UPI000E2B77E4|nr:hypothetical protein [Klebsiella pneumoniae]HAH4700324.1 hypothetical protein [Escherichia coli]WBU70713.1 hypothetical protein PF051_26025 [Klebsiella pneumoniae]SVJ76567.1 Uncharacterised protein [Klebsiella pneumoniae]HAH5448187.1 hypothetical protein [Escherichia coli]HBR7476228.1 hypothetical protein [Klebsiella pneumoniae]
MERQQEIEERSRDLIRKADKKERVELDFLDVKYVISVVNTGLLLCLTVGAVISLEYEDFRDMQPATPEQLQSIIHDAPCAGEAFRMALQTNTVTSSATLTFGDAKKMASECKDKEEIKAVREKQLNALNDMSK